MTRVQNLFFVLSLPPLAVLKSVTAEPTPDLYLHRLYKILLLFAFRSLMCHFYRFSLIIVTYFEFRPNVQPMKTLLNKAPSWISRVNLFAWHCKVIWSHAEFKFSSQTAPKLSFTISVQMIIKWRNIFEDFFLSIFNSAKFVESEKLATFQRLVREALRRSSKDYRSFI